MDFKKILSQTDMDSFLSNIYWEHAFFREIFVLNPSFVYPEGKLTAFPDSLVNMAILIVTNDPDHPAIELKLEEVETIKIPFNCDIHPRGLVGKDFIEIMFIEHYSIRTKKMEFRILGTEVFGDKIRFGRYWEDLF